MALRSVKIDEKRKVLTIEMDLDAGRPSKSGKTMVVASTNGNVPAHDEGTPVLVNGGKPLTVGVNCYHPKG